MIQLRLRTEYSFRFALGKIDDVLSHCDNAAAITDRSGTWGHVAWRDACRKVGVKPIYGVELAVVPDSANRTDKKQHTCWMVFLAKNSEGLKEIYHLTTLAHKQKYYIPRIDYAQVEQLSENIFVIVGENFDKLLLPRKPKNIFIGLSPASSPWIPAWVAEHNFKCVAISDNWFPATEQREAYEILTGMNANRKNSAQHILSEDEWLIQWPNFKSAIALSAEIAEKCNADLPTAEMVHWTEGETLREMCEKAAPGRNIDLSLPEYKERLDREIDLIEEKEFSDYFHVIADLVAYAKKHMLVGPARGSSCGSLVCYLLRITEINPLPHKLLFERFIDINRADLPDIDIDFPDNKREMVFDYLRNKYGEECVARLGTISRYKAKSAIAEISKTLRIPIWETENLKKSIIERSSGDSRASFCILDTFDQSDVAKDFLDKYPKMAVAADFEMHARHSGQHAAGVIVTARPVSDFCSVDSNLGVAQVDKIDAEKLNLLKIDALGLRTLSVIEDTLESIGIDREWLLEQHFDDKAAFGVFNAQKLAGIFQFEGPALKSLCRQIKIEYFDDIAAITALARPGPLSSGGTTEWIKRRTGAEQISFIHESMKCMTEDTFGIVIYQEQVMQIAREVGGLSWQDVSALRKAMSKSLGKEFFDNFWQRFRIGAAERGIAEEPAKEIWNHINTMGSWSFNKSHAVAYGLMSYWTALLKAHYPLEFAAACLRHARDEDQAIKLLRELIDEGHSCEPINAKCSKLNWSVQEGRLIGGLQNVKGIGPKMAQDIIKRRASNQPLTSRQQSLLESPKTPYDVLYECKELWGDIYDNPSAHNITSKIFFIDDINAETEGSVLIIGKLTEKNLRDMNELVNLERRGGERVPGQSLYLNATVEDDTASIICTISRFKYMKMGKPIVEEWPLGAWALWKGYVKKGFRKIYIERIRRLS